MKKSVFEIRERYGIRQIRLGPAPKDLDKWKRNIVREVRRW
jgi:hypothetical protein